MSAVNKIKLICWVSPSVNGTAKSDSLQLWQWQSRRQLHEHPNKRAKRLDSLGAVFHWVKEVITLLHWFWNQPASSLQDFLILRLQTCEKDFIADNSENSETDCMNFQQKGGCTGSGAIFLGSICEFSANNTTKNGDLDQRELITQGLLYRKWWWYLYRISVPATATASSTRLIVLGDSGGVVNSALDFFRHRLSPLAAFTAGAYFLHNGRRWQWICEFYTANFKDIFGGP